jgi:hypothetical protein
MLEKHVNLLSDLEDLRSKFEKVFREMNVKKWLFRKA